MKKTSSIMNKSQCEITLLYPEENKRLEVSKSYAEYWKSAVKKIRFLLVLKRFSNAKDIDFSGVFKPKVQFKLSKVSSPMPKDSSVFKPIGKFFYTWLSVLVVSSLYLSTYSIYLACFKNTQVESHEIAVEFTIEIIYILDILVMINLATFDDEGFLILNRNEIFKRYLKSYLIFDVISAIPLLIISFFYKEIVLSNVYIFRHIFKLAKWVKISRRVELATIIKAFDHIYIKFKHTIDIFLVVLIVFFSYHVFGSFFFLSSRSNEDGYNTWTVQLDLYDKDSSFVYLTSIYWAATTFVTVGYGDIHPYSKSEKILTLFWIALGLFILSYSVGRFSIIFSNMLKEGIASDLLMAKVDEYAKVHRTPKHLKNRMKVLMRNTVIIKHEFTISSVILSLKPSLRYKIARSIYNGAIKKIPYFSNKSVDFISTFTFFLEYLSFNKNDCLWMKNCYADGIYFVISGRVKYFYKGILFYIYQEGGFFGDTEVFIKAQRKFDVFTSDIFKCFKVSIEKLRYLKEHYTHYFNELVSLRKTRTKNLIQALAQMKVLHKYRNIKIFKIDVNIIKNYETKLKRKLFKNDSANIELEKIKNIRVKLREFTRAYYKVKNLLKSTSRYI